jgi:hypothetical protein
VQKTGQVVNLFTKSAKALAKHNAAIVPENAAKLLAALEQVCEKDKSMSNLKGKIKEIKFLIKSA